jgi:hypothetical protein
MQTKWASELNPVLAIPLLHGTQLTEISLINGVTVINHRLQRTQQGWLITDISAAATIYRSQPFNSTSLTLTSSAAVTISLWVY